MTHVRTLIFLSTCALLALATQVKAEELPVAISGYSVVSYFTEGQAELGSDSFTAVHEGKRYLFTSAEQQAVFESNPEQYRPRYDLCPYSLALGHTLPLDPTNFQIIGGYLLLFHQSDEVDGLAEFKASGLSDEELIRRADKSYTLLRF